MPFDNAETITMEYNEVKIIMCNLKNSAPNTNNLTYDVLKKFFKINPNIFIDTIN